MVTLPKSVAIEDQLLVQQGERVAGELAALRYHWCEERGMRQREYADAVGVSQNAIAQSVALHRKRTGDNVHGQPVGNRRQVAAKSRPTPEQLEWRRKWVVKLYLDQRYTRNASAAALGIGHSTIDGDMVASGYTHSRQWGRRDDIEAKSIDWRAGPPSRMPKEKKRPKLPTPIEPTFDDDDGHQGTDRYKDSLALREIQAMVERFDIHRIDVGLAVDYDDALAVGDRAWAHDARAAVAELQKHVGYLARIVEDEVYRRHRQSGSGHSEPKTRPPLRAVT